MSAPAQPAASRQSMTYVLVPADLLEDCERVQIVADGLSPEEMVRLLLLRELIVTAFLNREGHVLP